MYPSREDRASVARRRYVHRARRAGGFTLIETALATVIVGTGVLAILAAQQAYHQKNDWAQRTNTAMLLANELRELTIGMPIHDPITNDAFLGPEADEYTAGAPDVRLFDDLDDFAGTVDANGHGTGTTFNPPINALRQTVPDLTVWTQEIQVVSVWPDHLDATFSSLLPGLDEPDTLKRVTVTVRYQGPRDAQARTITQLTWVVAP